VCEAEFYYTDSHTVHLVCDTVLKDSAHSRSCTGAVTNPVPFIPEVTGSDRRALLTQISRDVPPCHKALSSMTVYLYAFLTSALAGNV
jgi:hypothetical protein